MLDSKYLRSEIDYAAERLATRKVVLDTAKLNALEEQRRELQVKTQNLQAQRNSISKSIGIAKKNGEDVSEIMAQVAKIGEELDIVKIEQDKILEEINNYALTIPNLPDESVPVGEDENDNVEVRRFGTPREFNFEPKDHVTLGEALVQADFENARKITGARFSLLRGPIARLHRALSQYMLDLHVEKHGYTECYVPY